MKKLKVLLMGLIAAAFLFGCSQTEPEPPKPDYYAPDLSICFKIDENNDGTIDRIDVYDDGELTNQLTPERYNEITAHNEMWARKRTGKELPDDGYHVIKFAYKDDQVAVPLFDFDDDGVCDDSILLGRGQSALNGKPIWIIMGDLTCEQALKGAKKVKERQKQERMKKMI